MPETNELMKRPLLSSDIVRDRAMEMFMPNLIKYLGPDYEDSERPYIEEQIRNVLRRHDDGYGMARELERDGWEEDRSLVDLMDEGESLLRQAYKEILEQWIKCYGISPEREVGDTVGTTHWHRKGQVGVITKIYEDRAEYGVQYPDQPKTSWQLIPYEEVVDAPGDTLQLEGFDGRQDSYTDGAGGGEQLRQTHPVGASL